MQSMADRGMAIAVGATDRVARAEALLREVIEVLDAGEFDCAAAYAEMARQALTNDALA